MSELEIEGGDLAGCPRGEATSLGDPIGGEPARHKEPDVSVWDGLAGVAADDVGDVRTEDGSVILEDS